MEDGLERVRHHFSEGRTEQAIECLPGTSVSPSESLEAAREAVELKTLERLLPWSRRHAERAVTFAAHMRPRNLAAEIFEVQGGEIASVPLPYNDEDSAVFLIPNATVGAGPGMVSTADGKLIEIAPDWGEEKSKGDRAKLALGAIASHDESGSVLCRRVPTTKVIPEAIYVWVGCKHFSINLINVAHVALLREAVGDTRLPLVIPRQGYPPRQFELDAIRRMGFAHNEIIVVEKGATALVEKLWVPYCPITLFPQHIVSSSSGMSVFRRRLGVKRRARSHPGERIYISRRDAKWRLVENEDALIEMLQGEYGFRVIEFTGLELHERLEQLSDAEIVLGATGSNLFNMMFAPPGCWVVEILPDTHSDPAVRDANAHLALSMGHSSLRIPCDTRQSSDHFGRWDIAIRYPELRTGLDFAIAHSGQAALAATA